MSFYIESIGKVIMMNEQRSCGERFVGGRNRMSLEGRRCLPAPGRLDWSVLGMGRWQAVSHRMPSLPKDQAPPSPMPTTSLALPPPSPPLSDTGHRPVPSFALPGGRCAAMCLVEDTQSLTHVCLFVVVLLSQCLSVNHCFACHAMSFLLLFFCSSLKEVLA